MPIGSGSRNRCSTRSGSTRRRSKPRRPLRTSKDPLPSEPAKNCRVQPRSTQRSPSAPRVFGPCRPVVSREHAAQSYNLLPQCDNLSPQSYNLLPQCDNLSSQCDNLSAQCGNRSPHCHNLSAPCDNFLPPCDKLSPLPKTCPTSALGRGADVVR